MIGVGDKVRWKSDQYPKASREPFEVIAVYDDGQTVRLEGGATAPARMLEVVESAAVEYPFMVSADPKGDAERAGLMQVIEAQMTEIDRLTTQDRERHEALKAIAGALGFAEDEPFDSMVMEAGSAVEGLRAYPDEVTGLLGQLCIALGFDRHPGLPTGVPELDALVRYVMD